MRDSELNRDEFAIIGVDTSVPVYEGIAASVNNDSLIRAHVSLGDDLSVDVFECLVGLGDQYMDENKNIFKPVSKITPENVNNYLN